MPPAEVFQPRSNGLEGQIDSTWSKPCHLRHTPKTALATSAIGSALASPYITYMFANLLKRLTDVQAAPLQDGDARLSLAALLVRVAKSDGVFDAREVDRVDRILISRYGLSPFEATDLRRQAEILEREAPDTVRFTRAIKEAVPYEERQAVVEALWDVVLADGTRDDLENSLLRMVASFLGVNDRDSALARQRVQARQS